MAKKKTTASALVVMVQTECPSCGIPFHLPEKMLDDRMRTGDPLYCPSGHSIAFEVEKKA